MEKDKKMYYLYHIPGKKVGMTCNIYNRVIKQQGYKPGEFEILAMSIDPDVISLKETFFQRKFGYKVDRDNYKTVTNKIKSNTMVINVTEQTTTFPCPINKLKGNLMDNKKMSIKTDFGVYFLSDDLIDWIVKNAKTSMYNPSRSYVYNKAMDEFARSLGKPSPAREYYNQPETVVQEVPNVYDLIRQWADDRGIYKSGDSKTQFVKLQEEGGELARAILKNDTPEIIDAIGDMVVVLTNLAALEGLKIEDCVVSAYDVIKSRQGKMENGTFVKQTL
jgi:NTP pyrophosphatase (non-canonical NTP hydrolase)